MRVIAWLAIAMALLPAAREVQARTVWRCLRDGTVSLATAPEPGSTCSAKELDDGAAALPNLWGSLGEFEGTLYQREQDGRTVYSTRNLPGSTPVLAFAVKTPPGSPAHAGLGRIGAARTSEFKREFKAAARRTKVDEAWLRAIAHAESAYDPKAVSDKGAMGVMQLMPEVARELGVADPFDAAQSIMGGARHLAWLEAQYGGDLVLVAAAYNAGIGAVTQHGGVPPWPETREYVAKVEVLYARYRKALGLAPRSARLQPAR
ncbi:MAG: lytic transglycosylase domain-containing protein [Lysobacteraceae bacterium]|nr:MAG: lytic transglycosylase domain-containing protein [Xanthomonadaceae bacterium]